MTLAESECNEGWSESGVDPESERVWAKLFGIPGGSSLGCLNVLNYTPDAGRGAGTSYSTFLQIPVGFPAAVDLNDRTGHEG